MIFKQRVLQDTKDPIHILSMLISLLVVGVLIICVDLNVGLKSTIISLMVILVIGMLCILIAIKDLEWFIIYKDRIEVKTIYHIRNIVYFKDVVFIEEIKLQVFKMQYIPYFIFNDGRKNNNNIFDYTAYLNKKNFNLRIYKTPELEEFITNHIKIEIKNRLNK